MNRTFSKIRKGLALAALCLVPLCADAALVQNGVYGTKGINIFTLATNVNDGETMTLKSIVFEVDLNPSNRLEVTTRQRIDLGTNGVQATNTVIATNLPVVGNQIVIQDKTYTFVDTLTNTFANAVLIGGTTAASLTNLYNAINLSSIANSGQGTNYSSNTSISTNFYASALNTTQVVVKSRSPGKEGNSFTVSVTGGATTSNGWVNTTFKTGAGPVPATDPFVVTNIVRAINQYANSNIVSFGLFASVLDTNQILIQSLAPGQNGATNGDDFAGSSFAATATYGGVAAEPIAVATGVTRVPKTDEVTQGELQIVCQFTPRVVLVNVITTSTGAKVAWDGALIITGNRITLDNSGSTDWATTSTIYVLICP